MENKTKTKKMFLFFTQEEFKFLLEMNNSVLAINYRKKKKGGDYTDSVGFVTEVMKTAIEMGINDDTFSVYIDLSFDEDLTFPKETEKQIYELAIVVQRKMRCLIGKIKESLSDNEMNCIYTIEEMNIFNFNVHLIIEISSEVIF